VWGEGILCGCIELNVIFGIFITYYAKQRRKE
jgi:hypothetical protein